MDEWGKEEKEMYSIKSRASHRNKSLLKEKMFVDVEYKQEEILPFTCTHEQKDYRVDIVTKKYLLKFQRKPKTALHC